MAVRIATYARLLDVLGTPALMDKIHFVPALLEVDSLSSKLEFSLAEHGGALGISDDHPLTYGLWIRARIPRMFGFAPLHCANNWQPLVNLPFLAVGEFESDRNLMAYPFICTEWFHPKDDFRESPSFGLLFSKHGPGLTVRARIAKGFWSLLLSNSSDLAPFSDFYYNECGRYCAVGFEKGEFFVEPISDDNDDEILEIASTHFELFPNQPIPCPDCDGMGVEDSLLFPQDCQTCGGTGMVAR